MCELYNVLVGRNHAQHDVGRHHRKTLKQHIIDQQVRSMEAEIAALKSSMVQSSLELESQLSSAKTSLAMSADRLQSIESETSELSTTLVLRTSKVVDLESKLSSAELELRAKSDLVASLSSESSTNSAKFTDLDSKLSVAIVDLQVTDERAAYLESQLLSAKSDLESSTDREMYLFSEMGTLRSSITQTTLELESQLSSAKINLAMSADRVKNLESDMSALSTTLLLSNSKVADLESKLLSTAGMYLTDGDSNEDEETTLGLMEDEETIFEGRNLNLNRNRKRKRSAENDERCQMNQEDKYMEVEEEEKELLMTCEVCKSKAETEPDRLVKIVQTARQLVLSVGSGDGSQQAAIALAGHVNLITTFYDTEEEVIEKYHSAPQHLKTLRTICSPSRVLFGIDATKLSCENFINEKPGRLYYFPHTGNQKSPQPNQDLIKGFLASVHKILEKDGEVHVALKTSSVYKAWKFESLVPSELEIVESGRPVAKGMFSGYVHRLTNGAHGSLKSVKDKDAKLFILRKTKVNSIRSVIPTTAVASSSSSSSSSSSNSNCFASLDQITSGASAYSSKKNAPPSSNSYFSSGPFIDPTAYLTSNQQSYNLSDDNTMMMTLQTYLPMHQQQQEQPNICRSCSQEKSLYCRPPPS